MAQGGRRGVLPSSNREHRGVADGGGARLPLEVVFFSHLS